MIGVAPKEFLIASLVFFVTSFFSVVTGGTSLITVPTLIWLGLPAATAIGTNMLALATLSIGASASFYQEIVLYRLPAVLLLTVAGSTIGAALVSEIRGDLLPLIIGIAMLTVAFVVAYPTASSRHAGETQPSLSSSVSGYGLTLALGVYGGFFSGGYVTLLTAVFVRCFKMSFIRAVATTKVVNAASSMVATAIFAEQGLIMWQIGLLLCGIAYIGAALGARVSRYLSELWLRRLFVAAVLLLAGKTLAFDVAWSRILMGMRPPGDWGIGGTRS